MPVTNVAVAVASHAAELKAKTIKDKIAEALEKAMPAVLTAVVANALTRTPTVDEEYNQLMAEDGGVAIVPRQGGTSADSDDRTRLIKPEETYLENAVANSLNSSIVGTTLMFGNPAFLDTQARYRYINKQMISYRPREYEFIEHEVAYLDAVLEGKEKTIVPVFQLGNRHKYSLRPSDDESDPGEDSMEKSFTFKGGDTIFAPLVLRAVAFESLTTALSELKQGA